MFKTVFRELKEHAPFTFLGALSGIVLFILLKNIPYNTSFKLFYVFHPLHVLLSSFVTASMYRLHKKNPNIIVFLLIGFLGPLLIATVSDSIIPYIGETLMHLPHRELHLGFIERWYIVNPVALLGVGLAYFIPNTKFPHSAHILISTWASLFHVMMAIDKAANVYLYSAILLLLFLSDWIPCCFSDIVFPLLFVKGSKHECMCSHSCQQHSEKEEGLAE